MPATPRDPQPAASDLEISLIPVTIPEMLLGTVILPPRRDHANRQHWSQWRRRHQYPASQAHRHLNAYAIVHEYEMRRRLRLNGA